jgi:hypothetical protein
MVSFSAVTRCQDIIENRCSFTGITLAALKEPLQTFQVARIL